jgi:hypothetical protein
MWDHNCAHELNTNRCFNWISLSLELSSLMFYVSKMYFFVMVDLNQINVN